ARPLIADHDNFARLDLIAEDTLHRIVLAFVDTCRTRELEDRFVHASRFDDTAIKCDVALEDGKPTIMREGICCLTDDAVRTAEIAFRPAALVAECDLCRNTPRRSAEEIVHVLVVGGADIPLLDCMANGGRMNGRRITPDQARAIQFPKDGHDTARP